MRISSEIRMWECGPACPIKQCLAAREDQICDGNVKSFKLWGCYLLILLRLNKLWDVLCHLFLLENCDIED
ncbi:hypothetical protein GLYMA_01G093150v4 [Glycine max]|nr:hypothetical protein GLYMA_01G093150v4 [Glycine max]